MTLTSGSGGSGRPPRAESCFQPDWEPMGTSNLTPSPATTGRFLQTPDLSSAMNLKPDSSDSPCEEEEEEES